MRSLLLIPTLLLAACGQSDQTVSYEDSEGNEQTINVEDNGDTRTVTSEDGLISAEGSQGGANARFPDYAPQYPGSTVQSAIDLNAGTAQTGGVTQHTITMMTSDTPEAVIAFYAERAAASGKSVTQLDSATGPMLIIGGTSLMDMEGAVTAMPAGAAGTSVNVTVQEGM